MRFVNKIKQFRKLIDVTKTASAEKQNRKVGGKKDCGVIHYHV